MSWAVFSILAYVLLAMQIGLAPTLYIDTAFGSVEPRFMLLVGVLVALNASPRVVLAAWAILGLLVDLAASYPTVDAEGLVLIGPYALGYLAGAYVAIQLRSMVLRQHPLTFAFMVLASGLAVHLVVVAILVLRSTIEPAMPGWSGREQLLVRILCLFYTAALAVPLAVPLLKIGHLLGFTSSRFRAPGTARRVR